MASKKRGTPEINAGSMADIAFLLLIFFLVTTTMDTDTGVRASLPPLPEEDQILPEINKRNVLEIRVNSANQLLVEGELMDISELKDFTKKFITNYGRDKNLSDNPNEAIVSLQNDRGTEYDIYIQIQDNLRIAYREVQDAEAQKKYGLNYSQLNEDEKKVIKAIIPQKISEAEPKDLGQ